MNRSKYISIFILTLVLLLGSTKNVFADTYGQKSTCSGTYGQESECGEVLGSSTDVVYLADTALDSKSMLVLFAIVSLGLSAYLIRKKVA